MTDIDADEVRKRQGGLPQTLKQRSTASLTSYLAFLRQEVAEIEIELQQRAWQAQRQTGEVRSITYLDDAKDLYK